MRRDGVLDQIHQIFQVQSGAESCAIGIGHAQVVRGRPPKGGRKSWSFRQKPFSREVWTEHGIASLQKPHHRVDRREVGMLKRQHLAGFTRQFVRFCL